jgi:hypothetical protein
MTSHDEKTRKAKTKLTTMKTKILQSTLLTFIFALATAPVIAGSEHATSFPGERARPETLITQVVGGLHSPRGLAIGPGGQLYVAQTGDETTAGSIIEILNPTDAHPVLRTLVSGLANIGLDEGEFLGVSGLAVFGNGINFGLYAVMGANPQATGNPAFGNLLRVNYRRQVQTLINVGEFDYDWTADHTFLVPDQFPDANPYGVLVLPGHTYVIDAAANTLDEVMPDGSINVLAFFPNTTLSDAVPTCACQGPDGYLYVGTLALVDSLFLGPSAKVYRLNPADANLPEPWNTPMTVWASDLWPINGCNFGPDGNFYASQLFTNPDSILNGGDPEGDVVKLLFNNPATHISLTGATLSFTGGVAVGPNGVVYVADGTAFVPPGEGRIVRLSR